MPPSRARHCLVRTAFELRQRCPLTPCTHRRLKRTKPRPIRNASCSCATDFISGLSSWRRSGCWCVGCGWRSSAISCLAARVGTAVHFVGVQTSVGWLAGLLIALLVGFEAPTIWRWTLTRRRWKTLGFVVAEDAEMAEHRFYADMDRPHRVPRRRLPRPSRLTPRRLRAARRRRPTSSVCSRSREARDERGHRRLRLRQSALGGESLRARRARKRARSADPGHQRSRCGGARDTRGAAGRRRLRRLPARAR